MGSGAWNYDTFVTYSTACSKSVDLSSGRVVLDSLQDNFKQHTIAEELKPFNVMRQCCDTDEHPNTLPVLLALDVTGSMGQAAVETASALNNIMEDVISKVNDVEFAIMGIGDLAYDDYPIQISQFESDIRIAEHLDKVYFEFGGGGNSFESYTAAWYMGAYHTDLDCWKRGKKGIIITMGDENMNPYLPKDGLKIVTGDTPQSDIKSKDLYEIVKDKYDIHHIFVDHGYAYYKDSAKRTFTEVIPAQNYHECTVNALADTIVSIITGSKETAQTSSEGISW